MNAMDPGPVWPPPIPATIAEERVKKVGKNTVYGRRAQPLEIIPVFVFPASTGGRYVKGVVYEITGGRVQFDN